MANSCFTRFLHNARKFILGTPIEPYTLIFDLGSVILKTQLRLPLKYHQDLTPNAA